MKSDATLTAILPLARAGWRLFPIAARQKTPAVSDWPNVATNDEARLREWQDAFPSCGWACATGAGSGVWILDIDGETGNAWFAEQTRLRGESWAQTRKVKTNRGFHLYYRWPGDGVNLRNSASKIAPGIDTRGQNGFAIVPPSVHPTGTAYSWLGPPTLAPISAPQWLLTLATNASKLDASPAIDDGSGTIPQGQRNEILTSIAGAARRRGTSREGIEAALLVENQRCSPPLPTDEVKRIAASVASYAPQAKLRVRPIRSVAVDGDWRSQLNCAPSGAPMRIIGNAVTALRYAPDLAGLLAYDEFAQRTVTLRQTPWGTSGEWRDIDDLNLCAWLGEQSIFLSSKVTAEAAEIVAAERKTHPVREFLEAAARDWDGVARIENWLSSYLGCADSRYAREVGTRWLLGGVARIFQPGCLNDSVLLLEGRQGARKSTSLRVLAGEWFSDTLSAFGSKDSREELLGIWICELAELDRIRGAALERVKAFLSCPADHFRKSYGRRAGTYQRSTVFCGSTNDSAYLADETGARRFWPVKIGEIKIDDLARDRTQIWGEATVRYRNREQWWLSPETEALAKVEQEARFEGGVWDDMIRSWIARLSDSRFEPKRRDEFETLPWFGSVADKVNITDILIHAIGKNPADLKKGDEMAVGRYLKHKGWKMKQEGSGTNRGKRFYLAPNSEGA